MLKFKLINKYYVIIIMKNKNKLICKNQTPGLKTTIAIIKYNT